MEGRSEATAAKAAQRAVRSPRIWSGVFIGLQPIAILLFGYLIPNDSPFFPRCAFYALTKLYCPGCGSGRGLVRILHGDILGGLRQNWFLAIGIPVLALADLNALLLLFGKKPSFSLDRVRGAAFAFLVLVIAYWILRNLPFFPFTFLAPQPL